MGTVRNFTPEVIGILAKNIDDNAGGFVDFFQDFRLGCEVFQDADLLRDIITRSNNYLRVFMEIEDKTHADVIKLLDSVQEIEDRYCAKIRAATERMRAIRVQLQGFRDIMNTTVRNDTLTTLYGEGVSAGGIMGDPQKLAQARFDAEQKGLDFPLTAAQLAASEAAYQQIKKVAERAKAGLSDELINQYNAYPSPPYQATFGPSACYATCMLLVAHIFGFDIDMRQLIHDGIVRESDGLGLMDPVDYYQMERRTCATEAEYSEAIYNALGNGNPVIVELRGHFVVAVAADGCASFDDIWVMDPADGTRKRLSAAVKDYGDRPVIGIRICKPKPKGEEK